jgi:prephenate dehydrogenase
LIQGGCTSFKLQEKGLKLFKDLGMRIRYMEPKSHDKHIAYVSKNDIFVVHRETKQPIVCLKKI